MFKKSLHTRRCAIPSTGFFEWSQNGSKTKYRFNLSNENALYMAGIFNEFKDENKFVILTTTANITVADVHNRMPVILQKSMIEGLMAENFALSYLHSVMPSLQRVVYP